MDFTDLNKACAKDPYPLLRIDLLVDSTTGHELLSFMDAYSGYNQIKMYELGMEATSFVINRGTYCYKVMPLGLKNAGATYQRIVNRIFKEKIRETLEVYVDDMVLKDKEKTDHIIHHKESFDLFRKYNMKLNPEKCIFGVASRKFLGYLVTKPRIEANPNQIKVILEMRSPRTIKEMHSLIGRAVALSRFLSRSTDKFKPFFTIIKKRVGFFWTDECEEAFTKLKEYMSKHLLLSKPIDEEDLYLYLLISDCVVSVALVREN